MPTILIVDDSKTTRLLIQKFIASLRPDWVFLEAETGEEAVAMAGSHQPNYITMDVNMPGMSGLEATGHIRWLYPEIKITVCTDDTRPHIRVAAEKAGVYFVHKPVTLLNMAEAINYFEKPAVSGQNLFSADDPEFLQTP